MVSRRTNYKCESKVITDLSIISVLCGYIYGLLPISLLMYGKNHQTHNNIDAQTSTIMFKLLKDICPNGLSKDI